MSLSFNYELLLRKIKIYEPGQVVYTPESKMPVMWLVLYGWVELKFGDDPPSKWPLRVSVQHTLPSVERDDSHNDTPKDHDNSSAYQSAILVKDPMSQNFSTQEAPPEWYVYDTLIGEEAVMQKWFLRRSETATAVEATALLEIPWSWYKKLEAIIYENKQLASYAVA